MLSARFVFISAYFPAIDLLYAIAVKQDENLSLIVKSDWTNGDLRWWPMYNLSENPNLATPSSGNPPLDSIIYAINDSSGYDNDLPVKGYLVGGTKSIWAFDQCEIDDLNI